jgi:hypothetical protein
MIVFGRRHIRFALLNNPWMSLEKLFLPEMKVAIVQSTGARLSRELVVVVVSAAPASRTSACSEPDASASRSIPRGCTISHCLNDSSSSLPAGWVRTAGYCCRRAARGVFGRSRGRDAGRPFVGLLDRPPQHTNLLRTPPPCSSAKTTITAAPRTVRRRPRHPYLPRLPPGRRSLPTTIGLLLPKPSIVRCRRT